MVLFHLFFLLCTTIRQKYMVFFHLFFLLCTTICPKIKVHTDLFLYMYTTIRPKIRVHIDLFFYLHTTIRPNYRPLFHLFYYFFSAGPLDQKLGSSLIYFFHLHAIIRQKYMIFFLSFIFSLCTTIPPKNRVLINLLFLFVHNHSTKLGVTLTLLIYSFLRCANISFAIFMADTALIFPSFCFW